MTGGNRNASNAQSLHFQHPSCIKQWATESLFSSLAESRSVSFVSRSVFQGTRNDKWKWKEHIPFGSWHVVLMLTGGLRIYPKDRRLDVCKCPVPLWLHTDGLTVTVPRLIDSIGIGGYDQFHLKMSNMILVLDLCVLSELWYQGRIFLTNFGSSKAWWHALERHIFHITKYEILAYNSMVIARMQVNLVLISVGRAKLNAWGSWVSFRICISVQYNIQENGKSTNQRSYQGVGRTVEELGIVGLIIEPVHHV